MYWMIGGDAREYGPVDAEQLRAWIREGRAAAATQVRVDGQPNWQSLGSLPEFAADLGLGGPVVGEALRGGEGFGPQGPTERELLERDYRLDLGRLLQSGLELFTHNFMFLLVGSMIYLVITLGLTFLQMIPLLGILVFFVAMAVTGPLFGGLSYIFIRTVRRESSELVDLFRYFRGSFVQFMLCYAVTWACVLVPLLPSMVLGSIAGYGMRSPDLGLSSGASLALFAASLVGVGVAVMIWVSWFFAIPLIADRGMDFVAALKLSHAVMRKHWFSSTLVVGVVTVLSLTGSLLCGVGVVLTFAYGGAVMALIYEELFGARQSRPDAS